MMPDTVPHRGFLLYCEGVRGMSRWHSRALWQAQAKSPL